jgi:hypothetical protein
MQVCQVKLGSGVGYCLRQDVDKREILEGLRSSYGVRVTGRNGGGPGEEVRYRGHGKRIRKAGYWASLRPRGVRMYLAMVRASHAGGNGICAFIDRRVSDGHFYPRVILTRLEFRDADVFFDGTVFVGDMVRLKDQRHTFLVDDIHAFCGRDMRGVTTYERRYFLDRALSMHRPDFACDLCHLRVRPVISLEALGHLLVAKEPFSDLDYDVNAIVFRDPRGRMDRPGDEDVVLHLSKAEGKKTPGKPTEDDNDNDNDMDDDGNDMDDDEGDVDDEGDKKKEKEEEEEEEIKHTFYVKKTSIPDVYELHETSSSRTTPGVAPIAGVPSIATSKLLRDASASNTPLEFSMSRRFGKWVPVENSNGAS